MYRWLEFLKQHNRYYADILINSNNLESVQEDGKFLLSKTILIESKENKNKDWDEKEEGFINIDDEQGFSETTVEDLKQ